MKGSTMTRTIRFILAAISLLFMAFIVAAPMLAHAQQTLPTMCGAEASGKRYLQGDVWAGKSPVATRGSAGGTAMGGRLAQLPGY
jgi:hypothetical protein